MKLGKAATSSSITLSVAQSIASNCPNKGRPSYLVALFSFLKWKIWEEIGINSEVRRCPTFSQKRSESEFHHTYVVWGKVYHVRGKGLSPQFAMFMRQKYFCRRDHTIIRHVYSLMYNQLDVEVYMRSQS